MTLVLTERVQGCCPRGCGRTLILGAHGYVTCSWRDCPEPDAATKLLEREWWREPEDCE